MQEWKSVKNKRDCLDGIAKCQFCEKDIFLHPNYIKAGLIGCQRIGCKGKVSDQEFAEQLLNIRGWKFIKLEKEKYSSIKVHFICDKSHLLSMSFGNIKKGCGCKLCQKDIPKKRIKPLQRELEPVKCDCKIKNLGVKSGSSYICEHYNHAVLFPDSAEEWNYDLNINISPYKIAPKSKKKYWFRCKSCNANYEQCVCDRAVDNARCPYCSGHKVNIGISLATTHPHLLKEWSKNNKILPQDVTHGSEKIVLWICDNHEEFFEYEAMIKDKTIKKSSCPKCHRLGYEQSIGGHNYFVSESRKIHGDKYEYIEEYKSWNAKIKILCKIHGIFEQTPCQHKRGQGCPSCGNIESKSITNIKTLLENNNIPYKTEITFEGMEHISKLKIDILIFENIAIEADGIQHFKCPEAWGGDEALKESKERDIKKDIYCMENGISMIRIPYTEIFNENTLNKILNFKNQNVCFYQTYQEYYDIVSDYVNLEGVEVEIVKTPLN